jgi:hypothetical protein
MRQYDAVTAVILPADQALGIEDNVWERGLIALAPEKRFRGNASGQLSKDVSAGTSFRVTRYAQKTLADYLRGP